MGMNDDFARGEDEDIDAPLKGLVTYFSSWILIGRGGNIYLRAFSLWHSEGKQTKYVSELWALIILRMFDRFNRHQFQSLKL